MDIANNINDNNKGEENNDNGNGIVKQHRPDVTGRKVMRDISVMKIIVSKSIDYLESHAIKDSSQFLRESAPLSKVRELEMQFYNFDNSINNDNDGDIKINEPNLDEVESPRIVASLLLAVLKEMPVSFIYFYKYKNKYLFLNIIINVGTYCSF